METILRLLRGEPLDGVARELGVTAATLAQWREQFLAGGRRQGGQPHRQRTQLCDRRDGPEVRRGILDHARVLDQRAAGCRSPSCGQAHAKSAEAGAPSGLMARARERARAHREPRLAALVDNAGPGRTMQRNPMWLMLCHRLLGRAASESSRLRHVVGAEWARQGRSGRGRMSFVLPMEREPCSYPRPCRGRGKPACWRARRTWRSTGST